MPAFLISAAEITETGAGVSLSRWCVPVPVTTTGLSSILISVFFLALTCCWACTLMQKHPPMRTTANHLLFIDVFCYLYVNNKSFWPRKDNVNYAGRGRFPDYPR